MIRFRRRPSRKELCRRVTLWAERAMNERDRAEAAEEVTRSYRDALDVRLAADGLIEFRGKLYKRIDDEGGSGATT